MAHLISINEALTFILNYFSTYLTWPQIRINSWLGLESRVLEPLEIGRAFDSKPMPSPLSARPCSLQCGLRLTGEANQWVDPDPQGGGSSGNGSRGCLGRPPGWRLLVLTPRLFSAFSLTASLPLRCPMHSTPKASWDNREVHVPEKAGNPGEVYKSNQDPTGREAPWGFCSWSFFRPAVRDVIVKSRM